METKGKLASLPSLDAALPTCGVLVAGCGAVGPYFSNPTLRNFEPRVGFAWDTSRTERPLCAGASEWFDVLPMLYTTVTLNGRGAPFFENRNSSSWIQGHSLIKHCQSIPAGQGLEYGYVNHTSTVIT